MTLTGVHEMHGRQVAYENSGCYATTNKYSHTHTHTHTHKHKLMHSRCFSSCSVAGLSGDYIAVSALEVTFLPEEDSKTVRVTINDDTALESLENFFGNLVISSESEGIAEVTVPQATVNITDNDGKHYWLIPSSYQFLDITVLAHGISMSYLNVLETK